MTEEMIEAVAGRVVAKLLALSDEDIARFAAIVAEKVLNTPAWNLDESVSEAARARDREVAERAQVVVYDEYPHQVKP